MCPSGKVRHPSKGAARAAIKFAAAKRPGHSGHRERAVYWCLMCMGWHLTSHDPRRGAR